MVMERCNRSFGDFKTCRRKSPMKVAEALQNVVSIAKKDGRLVAGITRIASVLNRLTRSVVMMCIVEVNGVDTLQTKLFEAFCTEHNIKLIKVDSCCKLLNNERVIDDIQSAPVDTDCEKESHSQATNDCSCRMIGDFANDEESDTTCLLLTQSKHLTEAEEFVISYYDTFRTFLGHQYPVLNVENTVQKCQ